MPQPKKAILLIHGIGDQAQGAVLDAFTALIEQPTTEPRASEHTLRKPAVDGRCAPFSYLVHHRSADGRALVTAELHWSDLSTVATGFLAPLRNFFRLMVGAPDIVYAALGPTDLPNHKRDYWPLKIVRSLLGFAFWVMFLPCIAYNVAFAVMFATYAIVRLHGIPFEVSTDAVNLLGSILFGSIFLVVGRSLLNAYSKSLMYWAAFMLLLVALVAASSVFGFAPPRTTVEYKNLFDAGLIAIWSIPLGITYAFTAIVPILIAFFRDRWRGLLLANAAVYLIVRFWIVIITVVWLVILSNSLGYKQFQGILDLGSDSLWFMGYMWLVVAWMVVLVLVAYLSHERKSRKEMRIGEVATHYPRLIVPSSILIFALLVPSIWVIAFAYRHYTQVICVECAYSPISWWMPLSRQILENAWWLVAIGGVCIQLLGGGFKIATDIVNYFRTNALQRAVDPIAAVHSTFQFSPIEGGGFREAVRSRLAILWADLDETFGPFDEVDIVAHSLGTMVAIDGIRSGVIDLQGIGSVRLVTMGSPYRNIFQYYFPNLFPEISKQTLAVSECINIYRSNDYVGTTIADENDLIRNSRHWPKGHHGYFEDPKVISEIAVGRIGNP